MAYLMFMKAIFQLSVIYWMLSACWRKEDTDAQIGQKRKRWCVISGVQVLSLSLSLRRLDKMRFGKVESGLS